MPKKVSNQDVLNKKLNIKNSCYSIFYSKNILINSFGFISIRESKWTGKGYYSKE